jgi:dCTP deaminase
MSFWSGEKILANGDVILPFSPDQIDCNAYTLRMGGSYYRTAEQETGHEQKKTFLAEGESFLIPAGQFAFLLTKEEVNIPRNAMASISMRTGIKFQGLINVSGFHVDPGYRGNLIYAVYNASPSAVQICHNDPIFKIWFSDINHDSAPPPSAPPYVFDGKSFKDIGGDLIKGMSKEVLSLQSLADRLSEQKLSVEFLMFVWRAIVIGVVISALFAIITLALPRLNVWGEQLAYWTHKSPPMQSVPINPTK